MAEETRASAQRNDQRASAQERTLQRYVGCWTVIALLVGSVVFAGHQGAGPPNPLWLLATLWAVNLLAGVVVVYINYAGIREAITPSEIGAVLLMVLLRPQSAVVVAVTALLVSEAIITRLAVPKMIFNTAWQVTAIAIGSAVFHALAGPMFTAAPMKVLAATLAALIYVAMNVLAFTGLLATMKGRAWRGLLGEEIRSGAPLDLGMAMMGVLAAVLAVEAPAALPLLAVPTFMDYLRARARRTELELEIARKQSEAAHRARSEFLSYVSHELRTPLNAILGFGQLLELSALTTEDEEAVQHILAAGRHLLALIDDVLDLSRIDAGTMTISLDDVDVDAVVGDIVALIQPLASARSIRVTTGTEGYDVRVMADGQRFRQVLLNLLSNAVKYNRDGGDVAITCDAVSATMARVAIRDTGFGVDPARVNQLFEPFERLGAQESEVEGTGLGLAVSKQLVEAMGGTIGVNTTPGNGTTFWVDLPVARPPARLAAVAIPETGAVEARRTLLVVEASTPDLHLVEAVVQGRPEIAVVPAMHSARAIQLAHEHRPDLIVLALDLAEQPPSDILARLQADPRTSDIPVLIIVDDATADQLRGLREQGAFATVVKPIDVQVFLSLVDAAPFPKGANPGDSGN